MRCRHHRWTKWLLVSVESLVTGTVGTLFCKTCESCGAKRWKNV